MKQTILFKTDDVTPFTQRFIELWLTHKKYDATPFLTLGQVIELNVATSFMFYQDDSTGRFFDYSLQNEDSTIEWDGNELIETLFWQVCQNIKKRLSISRTFNSKE